MKTIQQRTRIQCLLILLVGIVGHLVVAQDDGEHDTLRQRRQIFEVGALQMKPGQQKNDMYEDLERPGRKRKASSSKDEAATALKAAPLLNNELNLESGWQFDRFLEDLSMSMSMSMP